MTEDARFEDAPLSDRPLRLAAGSVEDLPVISALCQDAVGRAGDIAWLPRKRRLVVVMNRFRWEDEEAARAQGRAFERVRSALSIEDVLSVRAQGISPTDRERVFSILALEFQPGEDGAGEIYLHLAGGAQLGVGVECLDLKLADLTRPWKARSGTPPHHPED